MRADELSAERLLRAYASGIFPMAESRDDPDIFWVDPTQRAVLPLDAFHLSRSLKRRLRAQTYKPTLDQAFEEVMEGCAARTETWINTPIKRLYRELFSIGHAHSLEVWRDDTLVGGVYGVSLGAAFFGESMFSTESDASKVALAYLVDRLKHSGFELFDAQFITDHLASLGAIEITRQSYHDLLDRALRKVAVLDADAPPFPDPQTLLHRMTQTS